MDVSFGKSPFSKGKTRLMSIAILAWFGFLALLLISPTAPAGETASAEDHLLEEAAESFSRRIDYDFLKFSPNGKRLASVAYIAGTRRLIIIELDPLRLVNLSNIAATYANDAEWIDDNTLLLVADDAIGGMALIRYNLEKDESELIDTYRSLHSNMWTANIFPPHTFRADLVHYMLISKFGPKILLAWEPESNKTETIFRFTHMDDAVINGMTAGDWLMEEWDGLDYKVTYRTENEHGSHSEENTSDEDPDSETHFSGSYLDKDSTRPLAMVPGRNQVYMATSDGTTHEIKIYDLEKRDFLETVLTDEQYNVDAAPLIKEHTGEVVGFLHERDRPTVTYIDKDFAGMMQRFDASFPDKINIPLSVSADGNRVIVSSFSSNDPGQYFIFDAEKNSAQPLLARAEWLYGRNMLPKEVIRYTARDGLEIEAYFTKPLLESSNKPLIILPHGGPHDRDTWYFDPKVQFFAALGYAVLQPNYRVSTGYGEAHFQKGFGEVGHGVQEDLFDAITWANQQGYGKGDQVCIVGGSFGAYSAMRAATLEPDAFRCVVAYAGLYDLVEFLEAKKEYPGYAILKLVYGDLDDEKDVERLRDASPLFDVEKLKAPVLVIHGERDWRVDVSHANKLIEELRKCNKEFDSLIRRDEGHGFTKPSNRHRMFKAMGEFLYRHMPVIRTDDSQPRKNN